MPAQPSITLRPFHEADTAFFTGLATDERVTCFVGDGRPWAPQTIQDRLRSALQQQPVEHSGAVRWFIAEEGGEAVGLVVATRCDEGVEIGYWVSPQHWGRGVAGHRPPRNTRRTGPAVGPWAAPLLPCAARHVWTLPGSS